MWSPMSAFMLTSMPEALLEGDLDRVTVLALVEHRRDRRDALAMAVHELAPEVRPRERLEQLEVQGADVDLGTAQRVVHGLAAQLRAVVHRRHVVEDLPGSPAERLVVRGHRRVEVADRQGHLGDRVAQAGQADR